jgi:NAD+ synthase (glutamine-hydrolysing)
MQIGLAQIATRPIAFDQNLQKIQAAYEELVAQGADLVVFPELCLWGYNACDHFFSQAHHASAEKTLAQWIKTVGGVPALLGSVLKDPQTGALYNAAFWIQDHAIKGVAKKCKLPYYDVFDEKRYFTSGHQPLVMPHKGQRIGILICEDAWTGPFEHQHIESFSSNEQEPPCQKNTQTIDPVQSLADQGVDLVINLSASPWSHDGDLNHNSRLSHPEKRLQVMQRVAQLTKAPAFYCNLIGAREELLFDGRSFCLNAEGQVAKALPAFEEALCTWNIHSEVIEKNTQTLRPNRLTDIHEALVFGIQGYAKATGFSRALVGLSGGIDSALVATLASEALGPQNVLGVGLPSAISSDHSLSDARHLAENLGIEWAKIPIENGVMALREALEPQWDGKPSDQKLAGENLQARVRGNLLMALSNLGQRLLLTTGNKSELAMGYGTLYGDMCGGLNPIGDLYKQEVYALAHHINRNYLAQGKKPPIPESTLTKEPSAELSPGQKDSDSLPPYPILDPILKALIEDNLTPETIERMGFEKKTIEWAMQKIRQTEYKRYQSPPILRCRPKAFGIGRRIPLV